MADPSTYPPPQPQIYPTPQYVIYNPLLAHRRHRRSPSHSHLHPNTRFGYTYQPPRRSFADYLRLYASRIRRKGKRVRFTPYPRTKEIRPGEYSPAAGVAETEVKRPGSGSTGLGGSRSGSGGDLVREARRARKERKRREREDKGKGRADEEEEMGNTSSKLYRRSSSSSRRKEQQYAQQGYYYTPTTGQAGPSSYQQQYQQYQTYLPQQQQTQQQYYYEVASIPPATTSHTSTHTSRRRSSRRERHPDPQPHQTYTYDPYLPSSPPAAIYTSPSPPTLGPQSAYYLGTSHIPPLSSLGRKSPRKSKRPVIQQPPQPYQDTYKHAHRMVGQAWMMADADGSIGVDMERSKRRKERNRDVSGGSGRSGRTLRRARGVEDFRGAGIGVAY